MVNKTNPILLSEQPFDIHEFNKIVEDDSIVCENCGNNWDGYAQCMCMGIIYSDFEDELINITENNNTSTSCIYNKNKKFKDTYIMNTYMDELVIHEYGTYNKDELNNWLELWNNWFNSE